jgi:hypothetical protein
VDVNVSMPQLSEDVGAAHVTTALQLPASFVCVMFDGKPLIAGSSSSVTVTVWVAVAAFPEGSVTVHVTVVVPTL